MSVFLLHMLLEVQLSAALFCILLSFVTICTIQFIQLVKTISTDGQNISSVDVCKFSRRYNSGTSSVLLGGVIKHIQIAL